MYNHVALQKGFSYIVSTTHCFANESKVVLAS